MPQPPLSAMSMASCVSMQYYRRMPLQTCPYYGSRQAVPSADVVLAPYSAVLMPDARESLGIELQDSVLVFDEAHNLLDAINSAHSTAVTGEGWHLRSATALASIQVYLVPTCYTPHTLNTSVTGEGRHLGSARDLAYIFFMFWYLLRPLYTHHLSHRSGADREAKVKGMHACMCGMGWGAGGKRRIT